MTSSHARTGPVGCVELRSNAAAASVRVTVAILFCVLVSAVFGLAAAPRESGLHIPAAVASGSLTLPGPTNAIQLRFSTNGAWLNTFDVVASGESLLASPALAALGSGSPVGETNVFWHSLVVNGNGPHPVTARALSVAEEASGAGWRFVRVDATSLYPGELRSYQRELLFVEPDLFVIHDHVIAEKPAKLRWYLHPPVATKIDPIWHDLRLETSTVAMTVHAPSRKGEPRGWVRIESPADGPAAATAAMELAPPNEAVHALDLVVVVAVRPMSRKTEYAFRLLESDTAVGVRVHRDGLPTLVAFRLDPATKSPSLGGFKFAGPVGVDVFAPKPRLAR